MILYGKSILEAEDRRWAIGDRETENSSRRIGSMEGGGDKGRLSFWVDRASEPIMEYHIYFQSQENRLGKGGESMNCGIAVQVPILCQRMGQKIRSGR